MFESAELPHEIDRATYKAEVPRLREGLLDAQFDLVERRSFPVIVLLAGLDGAGKGEAINRLYGWLDVHHLETNAFAEPSDEERERPRLWRHWLVLPPKGRIGVFFGSWYQEPTTDFILGRIGEAEFERELQAINRLELMLAQEGALILKFWFHLSADEQKRRLKRARKNQERAWYVFELATGIRYHGEAVAAGERAARITGTGHAPWVVVASGDRRYRDLTLGRTLLHAIRRRLDGPEAPAAFAAAPAVMPSLDGRTVLDALDLSLRLDRAEYDRLLGEQQLRLAELMHHRRFADMAVAAVFEGTDAAGKGGAIRRVIRRLDARRYRVHAIAAPTDEERAQPWLWRFWRRLPRRGHLAVFDRSWYGRVLVERVEGFAAEAEWLRAYGEINDFEGELAAGGILVVKFWLAISREEQLRRFEARRNTSYKRYKITDEDWRNHGKWDAYRAAVGDMVDRTSTAITPWTLVEAEDKPYARVKVLRTLCERIEAAL